MSIVLSIAGRTVSSHAFFHTSAALCSRQQQKLNGQVIEFAHDEPPHISVAILEDPHADIGPSFRRLAPSIDERDWSRRRGRWETVDPDYVKPSSVRDLSSSSKRRDAFNNPNVSQIQGAKKSWAYNPSQGNEKYTWQSGRRRRFSTSTPTFAFGLRESWAPDPAEPPKPVQRKGDRAGSRERPSDSRDKSVRESSGRERDWKKDRTSSSRETTMPVIKNRLFNPDSKGTPSKKSRVVDPLFTNAKFSSPPIMPGLLSCLTQLLGRTSKPTPIQTLSIKNFLETPLPPGWSQHLLASETGSGKSVAYMLPLLQSLKQSELDTNRPPLSTQREYNPRAIVLAPTHELSRQLASFAKALLHEIKLRVVCASKTNVKNNRAEIARSASHMKSMMNDMETLSTGEMVIGQAKSRHPVDVMVGTPMKLLEMVRGRGWDRRPQEEEKEEKSEEAEDEDEAKPRRGRDMNPGYGEGGAKHEMGLKNVEWVVVDEADVLFDPDFQATTRLLLSDISAARGQPVPYSPEPSNLEITDVEPHNYPFNLVLTTATVPTNLDKYLHKHHPQLVRLMSPNLHHFPPTLMTEYASWTGGNKLADIEKRLRQVWSEDAKAFGDDGLSKVLIFCNQSTKVEALGHYFKDKGIPNIAMTSQSELRRRGSNKHLDGFLKAIPHLSKPAEQSAPGPDGEAPTRVMITTSLLSRGLDFTPDIRHVFIIDEPRNVIDFLHRAGRAARAGERGKVVIFGKIEGRGSDRMRVVRKRVVDLLA